MNNIELESIHSQAFHQLAMNYRGAHSGEGAATAYAQLTAYIDERLDFAAQQREDERLRIKGEAIAYFHNRNPEYNQSGLMAVQSN